VVHWKAVPVAPQVEGTSSGHGTQRNGQVPGSTRLPGGTWRVEIPGSFQPPWRPPMWWKRQKWYREPPLFLPDIEFSLTTYLHELLCIHHSAYSHLEDLQQHSLLTW